MQAPFGAPVLGPWGTPGAYGGQALQTRGPPPIGGVVRPHRGGRGGGTFGAVQCMHCSIVCELDTRNPAHCARHRHANLLRPPVCCNCKKKDGWLDYDLHACEQCRARPTDPPPMAQPAVTIYKDRKQIVHQTKIQEVAATLKCNECRFTSTDPIAFARHAHSHVKEKVVEKERIVEVPGPERVVEKEVVKVVKELVEGESIVFRCSACDFETEIQSDFEAHVQQSHVPEPQVVEKVVQVPAEVKIVDKVVELCCQLCAYKTSNVSDYQNHVLSHVKEKVVEVEKIVEVPGPERIVERIVTKLIKKPEKPVPKLSVPEPQVIHNSPKVFRTGGGFLMPEEVKRKYPTAPREPKDHGPPHSNPPVSTSNGGVATLVRRGAGSVVELTDFAGKSRVPVPEKDFTRPPTTVSARK